MALIIARLLQWFVGDTGITARGFLCLFYFILFRELVAANEDNNENSPQSYKLSPSWRFCRLHSLKGSGFFFFFFLVGGAYMRLTRVLSIQHSGNDKRGGY